MKSWLSAAVLACVLVLGLNTGEAHASDGAYAHHVVFHVDDNDKAKMNIALNNAANVIKYYDAKGEKVEIEIVAYGPGLNMLRDDTSPVKARVEQFSVEFDTVSFAACGNTIKGMTKKEAKAPPLIKSDNVREVPSGVVQIMMRQSEGWNYIRP